MNYQQIVDDPSSKVKLKCIKSYSGNYDYGYGRLTCYSYKMGDVLERTKIFLKEENWEIAE